MNEIGINEIKKIQLEMLDAIHNYCAENKLTYYAAYGTLLGAVRHKGYIPWDDDIDIMMPRADYDKFIGSFNNNAHPANMRVVSHEIDPRYYLSFAKVINTETVMQEEANSDYQIGVYIDVFPLDNLSDDYETAKKHIRKAFIYNEILLLKNLTFRKNRAWYKNAALFAGRIAGVFWSRDRIIKSLNNFGVHKKNGGFTKYVGLIAGLDANDDRELFESEWFREAIGMEFEGLIVNAPAGFDSILKRVYGDYMKLPPIEEQKSHHVFKAWYNNL